MLSRGAAVSLIAILAPSISTGQFSPSSAVDCGGPQNHCYRNVTVLPCTQYDWESVSRYALGTVYNGMPGHLLTIESAAEATWNRITQNDSYVGALGQSNGPYVWRVGPSAGQFVTYYQQFVPRSTPVGCAPFSALATSGHSWFAQSAISACTRACGNCGCFAGERFIIEYEPDTVPPQSAVTSPAGSDPVPTEALSGAVGTPIIGQPYLLGWSASDAFGSLSTIDLSLSRSGPSGPFETIALDLPANGTFNPQPILRTGLIASMTTGQYEWTVTGPATNNAVLRITVSDAAGNTTSSHSAVPFSIDAPIPVTKSSWGRIKARFN